MKTKAQVKPMPSFRSDDEAEKFVSTADLSQYDLSEFKSMRFEVEAKSAALNMRLPASLLDAVKAKAKSKGIPYTRYVRKWPDEGSNNNNRLYRPINEQEESGKWKINRGERLYKGDTVFLSHAKYDNYSKYAAKSINAQIETQYLNNPNNNYPIFIKITPWFKGSAKIKVSGIAFDNRKSFLGLQIKGCSNPGGVPIYRINEGGKKSDENGIDDEPRSFTNKREIINYPDIYDITDDDEPDQNGVIVEIIDQEFEILGEQRVIIDVKKEGEQGAQRNTNDSKESMICSSGEPFGNKKGIKYASIYSLQLMESFIIRSLQGLFASKLVIEYSIRS